MLAKVLFGSGGNETTVEFALGLVLYPTVLIPVFVSHGRPLDQIIDLLFLLLL